MQEMGAKDRDEERRMRMQGIGARKRDIKTGE